MDPHRLGQELAPIQIDPRFANKMRPVEKKPKPDGANNPQEQRTNLQQHQNENLRNLDAAQKSLAADEKTLGQMEKWARRAGVFSSGKDAWFVPEDRRAALCRACCC